MTAKIAQPTFRRPIVQSLVRYSLLACLGLLGAYVTLPWWLPSQLVRRQVERSLCAQTGMQASIGGIRISWKNGVELSDVRIRGSAGERAILSVSSLRAPLAPMDLLVFGKLAWLVIDSPRMDLTDGLEDVDLGRLLHGSAGPRIDCISVSNGQISLFCTGLTTPLNVCLPSLQARLGGRNPLDSLTLTATIEDQITRAPVAVRLETSSSAGPVRAYALVCADNLELAWFDLAGLAGLPADSLAGLCSGTVSLEMDRQGIVNSFKADFAINRLDVQPTGGAFKIPVIDRAEIKVQAGYDPILDRLTLEQFRLVLPGANLIGGGLLTCQPKKRLIETIQNLHLAGRLDPATLSAVMLGRTQLAGGVEVDGPVDLELSMESSGPRLNMAISAKADQADVMLNAHVIKPAKTDMLLRLVGMFDTRSGVWTVQEGLLTVGKNRFEGQGVLPLRDLLAGTRMERRDMPELLSQLEIQGGFEINDAPALKDLLKPACSLPNLEIAGPLTGRLIIEHSDRPRLRLSVESPVGTACSIRPWLDKPADLWAGVDVWVGLGSPASPIDDLEAELAVGQTKISLDADRIERVPSPDSASAVDRLSLRFDVQASQGLQTISPMLKDSPLKLEGDLTGRCTLLAGGGDRTVLIDADLEDLAFNLADLIHKPRQFAGSARLQADFNESGLVNLTAALDLEALIEAELEVFADLADDRKTNFRTRFEVRDAGGMGQLSPALADWLKGADLAGSAQASAEGSIKGGDVEFEFLADGSALDYFQQCASGRKKPAGVSLDLAGKGSLLIKPDGVSQLTLKSARLAVGGVEADVLQAEVVFSIAGQGSQKPADIRLCELSFRSDWRARIDEKTIELLPELEGPARRWTLNGGLGGSLTMSAAGRQVSVDAEINATDLGIGPTSLPLLSQLVKPAGLPARLWLSADMDQAMGTIMLHHLRAVVDQVHVVAGGSARLGRSGDDQFGLEPQEMTVCVWSDRLDGLDRLIPKLKSCCPAGTVRVDLRWLGGGVANLSADLQNVSGRWRDKQLLLSGGVVLEGINPGSSRLCAERINVDGLRFKIGSSSGTVIADLNDMYNSPSGRIELLFDFFDDKEFTDLFVTAPPPPAGRLPADQHEQLLGKAEKLIQLLEPKAKGANLEFVAVVDHLRTFDPLIEQTYDVYNLNFTGSLKQGVGRLEYSGGLNGGMVDSAYLVDLNDPQSTVRIESHVRDVLASPSLQPQLAVFFPGNTFWGLFDRAEELTAPLSHLVARMMDYRFSPRLVGSAKTVTTDGMLAGKALPKWVVRIFPGLNLTKYRYGRMTSFSNYLPDGVAVSDMVFSGQTYDIYIEGTTDTDNIGQYQIGLILLGTPQSPEWNHTYRQGRIPLLNFQARIEGGKMHDEKSSFLWPNQTLFTVFLKNNIFYRLWLNRQDRYPPAG